MRRKPDIHVSRKIELDLHGMRVDEAIPSLISFINDSYKARERVVWIIHGKGTGVLREEVRQYLNNNSLVEFFTPADKYHGGEEGATQVVFKER
ncbi:Smr/MutS family protein [Chloroflexota bacterium]